jgi:putative membrane protein
MKKQMLSYGLLIAATLIFSCNNEGKKEGDEADTSTNMSTGTVTTDTGTTMGTTGTPGANPNDTLGLEDRKFVLEAASGGMMEVEAGRLAEQTANNARVKSFGAMMVRDHSAANDQLRAVASSRNMTLPDSMMKKHRDHLESLRTKTGAAFDKAYMSMMVSDHREDVNKFQVSSNNAKDTAVKGFATRTLPVLRTHLDSAQAINKNMK